MVNAQVITMLLVNKSTEKVHLSHKAPMSLVTREATPNARQMDTTTSSQSMSIVSISPTWEVSNIPLKKSQGLAQAHNSL